MVQKKFWSKNLKSKTIWVKKKLSPKKCWSKKVWIQTIMGQQTFGFTKFWLRKKFGSKLFQILCQNLVSSWNIHDMRKFCQDQCFLDQCDHDSWNRESQELPLKFGQNWVSNSWDITYMDKCRQDKCCMEKMWLWQ